MPVVVKGKKFPNHAAAVRFLKRNYPSIKDPDAYVASIERKGKKS